VAKPAAVPLYLSAPERAFLSKELPELDAHYLQLRINKSFYDQKIEDFFKEVRVAITRSKPKNIIVDLRLDGGGDLNTTRAFMQELALLAPANGKIFVLTSGRTFSAGIASAGYLKQAAGERVLIVGEPIGDHLEFWAEGGIMELPVSKAYLLPATERHNYVTGCPEADCHRSIREHPIRVQSLEPDITAPLTYADYRAGRDPALEAVRKALGR
jgi:C-terminal processing protease CtpA/Prc